MFLLVSKDKRLSVDHSYCLYGNWPGAAKCMWLSVAMWWKCSAGIVTADWYLQRYISMMKRSDTELNCLLMCQTENSTKLKKERRWMGHSPSFFLQLSPYDQLILERLEIFTKTHLVVTNGWSLYIEVGIGSRVSKICLMLHNIACSYSSAKNVMACARPWGHRIICSNPHAVNSPNAFLSSLKLLEGSSLISSAGPAFSVRNWANLAIVSMTQLSKPCYTTQGVRSSRTRHSFKITTKHI